MKNIDKDSSGLGVIRKEIDQLDEQIQSLISERARLAFRVRESKGESASAVDYYRPEREAQVLRRVIDRNEGPLSNAEPRGRSPATRCRSSRPDWKRG